ncbi:M24 family metallopeptidase [Silvibacterium dinghuense]|uniref:Aminopeptidase P family protein n=1 Tax=Silvibacterium dinghuense TaxID=1560006 RepID=A0A4Q1SCV2_9BACT|nr:aminopeptidase P family protein [Silvibacterium dinghuense]RXS95049.1 aminopeptidase P family protein [Silvibacterium dinghuense]GGH10154.1 putative peptidase YqhT [Silvibacterium dinghuense]
MKEVERLRALRKSAASLEIEAILITHLPDVRYLTGFTGSNAALAVTASKAVLFTDGRYTAQAKEEVKGARVVIAKGSALKEACAWLEESAAAAGFDPANTTVSQLEMMRSALSGKRRRSFFQPLTQPLAADLRMVKDEDELRAMTAAAKLGNRVFKAVLPHLKPGVPETEIAAGLEFFARSMGAEAMSFETIVASGERSALPHGRASSRKLPRKGFVTLDFGVILKGYCSDMTRTVHLGKANPEERHAYEAVLAAQEAAVSAIKPGVTCGEVDEAARSVLRSAGLAKYFTHSTGHGVGLEIHENPRVAAAQAQILQPGMVVTVEPGVYMPGKFGIRIEDMVAVTGRSRKVLTPVDKKLIEL